MFLFLHDKDMLGMLFFTAAVVSIPRWRTIFFPSYAGVDGRIHGREQFFDIVKGVAIIAVIVGHTAYFYYRNHAGNDTLFLSAVNHLCRFAIPFFLICSGMFLSDVFRGWRDAFVFYRKKILTIFVPFFLANVLIFFFIKRGMPQDFMGALVTGTIQLPYYYIIMLFQLYALVPLLAMVRTKRSALIAAFCISLFFLPFPAKSFVYALPFAGPYFFFFFYGMYRRNDFMRFAVSSDETKIWLAILALYFFIFVVFPDVYFNIQIFYGVAVWNLCMLYRQQILRWSRMSSVLAFFGRTSLWIYLLHYLVIQYAYAFLMKVPFEYHGGFVAVSIVAVCISAGVGYGAARAYDFFAKSATRMIHV